ncbi:MAG TPA: gamma-glutamyltransferase [Bryobacteraceae bacterium]|nr:gamma-glutamyltransferase [Bryobacteraceae bacterium]
MRWSRFAAASLCILCGWQSARAASGVRAQHAMVVTREAHATDAAVSILKSGGNAVDAAIAAGFALAVTHPSAGNLGGGGFMLIRMADGRSTFIDFREAAPARASRDMYLDPDGRPTRASLDGWRACGVPGTVRGFELASKKYGRKRWAELVAPAIGLAGKGFQLTAAQAESLKNNAARLEPYDESKRIFLKRGAFYSPGEFLAQPQLAVTLERIAHEGAGDFYEGSIARRIAAAMAGRGGLITLEDLKAYRAIERAPLQGKYRGYDVVTAPPPSSGGIGLLQMCGVLEATGFEKYGAGSPGAIHWAAEAMRRFFADRSLYLGDPAFTHIPLAGLIEPQYAAALRRTIDAERATPSAQVRPGRPARHESMETTHYSIVDREGNAVAVTYTLNGSYGSGVTVPGLGFLLNNEMDDFSAKPGAPNSAGLVGGDANAISPGKRPLSSMTPTIVLRGGKPYLVVGSPGGPQIITTVLEVIENVIDFHMGIQDAVAQPRFHHQWLPDILYLENAFPAETEQALRGRGYTVERLRTMGEAAAILAENGWLEGAADPRVDAKAAGY